MKLIRTALAGTGIYYLGQLAGVIQPGTATRIARQATSKAKAALGRPNYYAEDYAGGYVGDGQAAYEGYADCGCE